MLVITILKKQREALLGLIWAHWSVKPSLIDKAYSLKLKLDRAPEDDMWSCPLAYTHKNTYIHTNTQNNVTPKETLPLLLVLVAGMKSSHRLVNINVQSWYYTVQGFHWNLQGLKKPKRLRRNTPKPLWTCQDEQRSLLHKPCKWLNPSLENNVRLSLFPKDWGKGLEIWPLGTVPSLRAWRHGFATLATMEK